MYVLAHLGIGYGLVRTLVDPWRKGLPRTPILVGTILPDLIDKPIYYGLVFLTGRRGNELGVVAGTRGFAHTAIFLTLLGLAALCSKGKWAKIFEALAWGTLTHLFLDLTADIALTQPPIFSNIPGKLRGLFWPVWGWQFPEIPYQNAYEQIGHWVTPFSLASELVGTLLLVFFYIQYRRTQSRHI